MPPQARAGSGDGVFYGRAVVRRVCGHVARRLAAQRGQVCNERLALETPAVPATPAPDGHAPRAAVRREATITARGLHARRAANQAAPVAPRPGRASASRLTRAARGPWAAPTRSPEKPVSYQSKPPLGAPA